MLNLLSATKKITGTINVMKHKRTICSRSFVVMQTVIDVMNVFNKPKGYLQIDLAKL